MRLLCEGALRRYAKAAAPFGEDGDLVLPGAARVRGRAAAENQ